MPAPATPPRKFRPELVESSVKSNSSKRDQGTPNSSSRDGAASSTSNVTVEEQKPKRFKAVPIETTKSDNRQAVEHNNKNDVEEIEGPDYGPLLPHERAEPSNEESKTAAPRKFAVEPVESSARSNRKPPDQSPELRSAGIESKDQAGAAQADATSRRPARRKFKVELIETAKRSHKSGDSTPALQPSDKTNASPGDASHDTKPLRPHITPLPPTNTPHATTDSVPISQLLKPIPNRQGSMRPHNNTRMPTRSHSFKVPNLESIESSESDRSDEPSGRNLDSTLLVADRVPSDATRMRESVDDRFSGYLLALAARTAEKQLRDQEAALFPSTDKHERVMHYVDHDDSGSEGVASPPGASVAVRSVHPTRRDSGDEKLLLKEMQQHGEQRQKNESDTQPTEQRKKTKAFNVEFDADAQQNAWVSQPEVEKTVGGAQQRDPDMRQMRKAASPPMLGGDLDFPRCPSPEHARFDVTQGSDLLRSNMCYLMNRDAPEGGLWGGLCQPVENLTTNNDKMGSQQIQAPAGESLRPPPLSKLGRSAGKPGGGGLWGGLCNAADAKESNIPTGLMTPKRTPAGEIEDPLAAFAPSSPSNVNTGGATVAGARRYPQPLPSPPNSASGITPISSAESKSSQPHATIVQSPASLVASSKAADKTARVARLKREFPDTFVTQVYNYLSLGFPALARKYDDELAKISGMSVSDLRRDDSVADQRGYLRLGEGENNVAVGVREGQVPNEEKAGGCAIPSPEGESDVIEEDMCNRWCALRIYVREWGRQMGCDVEGGEMERRRLDPSSAWGVPARKGSWGN